MIFNISKKKLLILSAIAAVVIVAVVLGLVYGLRGDSSEDQPHKVLKGGAVTSNGEECAAIGARILQADGSAVDAAIAIMLCDELTNPQSTGLGGGFLATVYERETGVAQSLDARETAPLKATEDMFVDNGNAAVEGGLAIATPGVLAGFWELHQRYGKLPWRALFEPTIELCRSGVPVSWFLEQALEQERTRLTTIPSLREIFVDPETGDVWEEGDIMKREVLADTLEVMADEGVDALYSPNGTLLPKLLADLEELGSILTGEDFYNYKPRWLPPASTTIRQQYHVHSMPLPGGGPIAVYALNLLDTFENLHPDDTDTWHAVAESFKHAYGARTRVADPDFVPGIQEFIQNITSKTYAAGIRQKIYSDRTFDDYEYYGAEFVQAEDHGTAHVSVLAPNGDAVAMTATINTYFGCKRRSSSTGLILNNIMDDFSTPGVINSFGVPASPVNFVAPGKRPLSAMTPTIVTDSNGDVRMVVGAAGGTRITTSTVLMILRSFFFGQDLETAIAAPRLHHQLAPNTLNLERTFAQSTIDGLAARGHEMNLISGIGTVTAIARERDDSISAAFDHRRGGSVEILP